jgi:hypothetical protein
LDPYYVDQSQPDRDQSPDCCAGSLSCPNISCRRTPDTTVLRSQTRASGRELVPEWRGVARQCFSVRSVVTDLPSRTTDTGHTRHERRRVCQVTIRDSSRPAVRGRLNPHPSLSSPVAFDRHKICRVVKAKSAGIPVQAHWTAQCAPARACVRRMRPPDGDH